MKYFSLLMLTAILLCSSAAVFAEESDSFNFDNVINMDLDAFEQPIDNQPSLEKGRLFLDETLTALKNETSNDPDARDEWKNTPLMWAVGLRDIKAVEYLLAHGANVNATNQDSITPFGWLFYPFLEFQQYYDINDNNFVSIAIMLANSNIDFYQKMHYSHTSISPITLILGAMFEDLFHGEIEKEFTKAMIYVLKKKSIKINKKIILEELKNCLSRLLPEHIIPRYEISFIGFIDIVNCAQNPILHCYENSLHLS